MSGERIYESIIGDAGGAVTGGLLRATALLKNKRLLPLAFDKAAADRDVAVISTAADDMDFDGDGDVVRSGDSAFVFDRDRSHRCAVRPSTFRIGNDSGLEQP